MDSLRTPQHQMRFVTHRTPSTASTADTSARGLAPHPRQVKTRTGCAECKRRRVKCDEAQPRCRRCLARGDACSGPRKVEEWQTTVLEDKTCSVWELTMAAEEAPTAGKRLAHSEMLRYFSVKICGGHVVEHRTGTTILAALQLQAEPSPALLHAIGSMCVAHRAVSQLPFVAADPATTTIHFRPPAVALAKRNDAMAALRAELSGQLAAAGGGGGTRPPPPPPSSLSPSSWLARMHCVAFTAAVLAVSTQWLDASGHDCGLLHLRGAAAALELILQHKHKHQDTAASPMPSPFSISSSATTTAATAAAFGSPAMSFYLVGTYVYLDMAYSFLASAARPLPLNAALAAVVETAPPTAALAGAATAWDWCTIHPITRLATPLCLVVARVSRYYRAVIDHRRAASSSPPPWRDARLEDCLEQQLLRWEPTAKVISEEDSMFTDACRILGLVMLEQARCVAGRRPCAEEAEGDEEGVARGTTPAAARLSSSSPTTSGFAPNLPTETGSSSSRAAEAAACRAELSSLRRKDVLVNYAVALLRNCQHRIFPHIDFVLQGLLLLVVGPEVQTESARAMVEDQWATLFAREHTPHHLLARDLVRECWRLRDGGSRLTWLEIMVEKGLELMVA